jgi:hypothetical protein
MAFMDSGLGQSRAFTREPYLHNPENGNAVMGLHGIADAAESRERILNWTCGAVLWPRDLGELARGEAPICTR